MYGSEANSGRQQQSVQNAERLIEADRDSVAIDYSLSSNRSAPVVPAKRGHPSNGEGKDKAVKLLKTGSTSHPSSSPGSQALLVGRHSVAMQGSTGSQHDRSAAHLKLTGEQIAALVRDREQYRHERDEARAARHRAELLLETRAKIIAVTKEDVQDLELRLKSEFTLRRQAELRAADAFHERTLEIFKAEWDRGKALTALDKERKLRIVLDYKHNNLGIDPPEDYVRKELNRIRTG